MNKRNIKRSEERINFWTDHILSWESSGLSQSEYSRQNNIDFSLFSKWKIRLKKNGNNKAANFIEVKTGLPYNLNAEKDIILVIKNIYKIKIKPDFNKECLKNLLSIIGDIK